jgi:hypothetical protein
MISAVLSAWNWFGCSLSCTNKPFSFSLANRREAEPFACSQPGIRNILQRISQTFIFVLIGSCLGVYVRWRGCSGLLGSSAIMLDFFVASCRNSLAVS